MESLQEIFQECGQGHVFDHVKDLPRDQLDGLLKQLGSLVESGLHPQRLNEIFEKSISSDGHDAGIVKPLLDGAVVYQKDISDEERSEWRRVGLEMIGAGKLGILLLAGGQGTRLGSSKPKGCYDVGLPSRKSLFQLQAERILRLQTMAGCKEGTIRWYIMTSPATNQDTMDFFESHGFFGLKKDQIVFFSQGMLPAFTEDGKIIMEEEGKVAMAPDGNGGVYLALEKHGIFEDMEKNGVEALDCCSVDNILVRLGDPVFAGYCVVNDIQCGSRVVAKSYPEEKVGVFAQRRGKLAVVEYSELDPIEACAQDLGTGELFYNWSNICLHYFEREWLRSVSNKLSQEGTYHIAKKNIPSIQGAKVPGIKLELFIFDTFGMAEEWGLMEVNREEEFSPVKNGPGSASDSPDTARQDLLNLHTSWVRSNGGFVKKYVEISPLESYAGEDLEWVRGRTFRSHEDDDEDETTTTSSAEDTES